LTLMNANLIKPPTPINCEQATPKTRNFSAAKERKEHKETDDNKGVDTNFVNWRALTQFASKLFRLRSLGRLL